MFKNCLYSNTANVRSDSEKTDLSKRTLNTLTANQYFHNSNSSVLSSYVTPDSAVSYFFHGRTQRPQHFSIPSRFFSASRMSWLIWSIPSAIRSICSVSSTDPTTSHFPRLLSHKLTTIIQTATEFIINRHFTAFLQNYYYFRVFFNWNILFELFIFYFRIPLFHFMPDRPNVSGKKTNQYERTRQDA